MNGAIESVAGDLMPQRGLLEGGLDVAEVVKRVVKYLIEGLAVAVAAYYIPQRKLNVEDIVLVSVTAACTFALLDMYSPSVSASARLGAGLGIGKGLVA